MFNRQSVRRPQETSNLLSALDQTHQQMTPLSATAAPGFQIQSPVPKRVDIKALTFPFENQHLL